ncbi:MACRO domain-containing protein 1 [Aphelenchoides avenae]|nr:MACRO domain-containing protein 1 [Aphelenchus avenae]
MAHCAIGLVQKDITTLTVDAIVNAANRGLSWGGGVCGAIHRAAGSGLREECSRLGGCPVGDAKATGAHRIKQAKAIIHAVGPSISGRVRDDDRQKLARCYLRALDVARRNRLRSVAFPCISTGKYGYPSDEAAEIAIRTVRQWLREDDNDAQMKIIVFCVFQDKDLRVYRRLLPKYLPDYLEEDDAWSED